MIALLLAIIAAVPVFNTEGTDTLRRATEASPRSTHAEALEDFEPVDQRGQPTPPAGDDTPAGSVGESARDGRYGAGAASLSDAPAKASDELAPYTDRTSEGAIEAFAATAMWLTSSPAVRDEPSLAADSVATERLNDGDARMVMNMVRSAKDRFYLEQGAYRVVAHSGRQQAPDQVMVEVSGVLKTVSGSRWVVVGGVVAWSDGQWKLLGITPREVAQPSNSARHVDDLTTRDAERMLRGSGWRTFRVARS